MNSWIFGMVASAIKGMIKNPSKKDKMKAVCLEIYNAIKMAYAGDPDFE